MFHCRKTLLGDEQRTENLFGQESVHHAVEHRLAGRFPFRAGQIVQGSKLNVESPLERRHRVALRLDGQAQIIRKNPDAVARPEGSLLGFRQLRGGFFGQLPDPAFERRFQALAVRMPIEFMVEIDFQQLTGPILRRRNFHDRLAVHVQGEPRNEGAMPFRVPTDFRFDSHRFNARRRIPGYFVVSDSPKITNIHFLRLGPADDFGLRINRQKGRSGLTHVKNGFENDRSIEFSPVNQIGKAAVIKDASIGSHLQIRSALFQDIALVGKRLQDGTLARVVMPEQ